MSKSDTDQLNQILDVVPIYNTTPDKDQGLRGSLAWYVSKDWCVSADMFNYHLSFDIG